MNKVKPLEFVRVAITPFCDLRCDHCYVSTITHHQCQEMEERQLTLTQIKDFLDDMIENQKLNRIAISGGECLTQRAWPRTKELLEYAFEKHLNVQLETSGSEFVKVKDIYDLAGEQFGNILFHVSLDHVDASWVNNFRGKDNAFQRAVGFLKQVNELGGFSEIRYTVTNENFLVTNECYKFATELGVSRFIAKVLFPTGGVYEHDYLNLNKALVGQVQRRLIELSVNNKTELLLPAPIFCSIDEIPENANIKMTKCLCGDVGIYVSYDGDILPCPYLIGSMYFEDMRVGNIKDPTFDFNALWNTPKTFKEYRNEENYECTTYKIMAKEITIK